MSEQLTIERARNITHELREYGYDSGDGTPIERQTALEAADLIESLLLAQQAREKPEPMTVLDDLCATWKLEPQILAGMLVIYHCTYDGCVSYELPFNMGYERTRPEAIKRTVKYLTSPYTEPKGEPHD